MLWLANTGDDSITKKGDEDSQNNVLSHRSSPHQNQLNPLGPHEAQSILQAID
jgi:hypothetical protein